jgi:hypothetical protein
MITTDFTGNFGNHIFQYVTLRSVAEKKGFKWGYTNHIYGDYLGGRSQMDFLDLDYGEQVEGIDNEYKENIVNLGHTNVHQYHDFKDLEDNSKLVGCWQTEQYFDKDKVKEWLKYKPEIYKQFENIGGLDDFTCVINIRGGEYRGIREVLLPNQYWKDSIEQMLLRGVKRFVVVTDDVNYARSIFPSFPCHHYGIGMDYYLINHARWLILSNSSFAWMPAWLNEKAKMVIAPKYWARYNISDGYWASSNIFTKGWNYLNRDGYLQNYDDVVNELRESKYAYLYNLED